MKIESKKIQGAHIEVDGGEQNVQYCWSKIACFRIILLTFILDSLFPGDLWELLFEVLPVSDALVDT